MPPATRPSARPQVLFRVQLQKAAGWFLEPVDEEEAPGYSEVVKTVR